MAKLRRAVAFILIGALTVALIVGLFLIDPESDEEKVAGRVDRYLEALGARDWQAIYEMRHPADRGASFEQAEPEIVEFFNDMVQNACSGGPSSEVTIGGTDVDILVTDDEAVASWKATCNGERGNVTVAQRFAKIDGEWYFDLRG
jgi:hypothetical protein